MGGDVDATNRPGGGQDVPGDALRRIPPPQGGLIGKVQGVLESARFQTTITVLIVINAITLGLETSEAAQEAAGGLLVLIDRVDPTQPRSCALGPRLSEKRIVRRHTAEHGAQ